MYDHPHHLKCLTSCLKFMSKELDKNTTNSSNDLQLKYGHHISYGALGYGHSHEYGDVENYSDGHHYHGHSQEKSACPFNFPHVYDGGKHCCQYSQDCWGDPLEKTSTCCQYYRKCSSSICESVRDVEPGGLVRQAISTLAGHQSDSIVLDDQVGGDNQTDLINEELLGFKDTKKVFKEAAAEDGSIKKMIEEFKMGQQSSGSQNSNNSFLTSDNNQELNKIVNLLDKEVDTKTKNTNDVKDFDEIENLIIDLKSNPVKHLDSRNSTDFWGILAKLEKGDDDVLIELESNPLVSLDSKKSPNSASNGQKDMTLPKYEALDTFVDLRSSPLIDTTPPKYEAVHDAFVDLRSNPLKGLDPRDIPDSTSHGQKCRTLPENEAPEDPLIELKSNPFTDLDSRDSPDSTSYVQKVRTLLENEASEDPLIELKSNPNADLDSRDSPDSTSYVQKEMKSNKYEAPENPIVDLRSNPLLDSTSHVQKYRTLSKNETPRGTNQPQIIDPLKLSDDLEAFLGIDNVTNLTRQDIVKTLWKFIKQKELHELKQEKYFVPHKEKESKLGKRNNRNFGLGYGPGQTGFARAIGRAYGHDLVGHFDHRVGPLGPFGFYANFYSDRK